MRRRVRGPFGVPVIVGKTKAPPPVKPSPEPAKVTLAEIRRWGVFTPPLASPRCGWWLVYIENGWRPDKRIRSLGFLAAAEWFGVYVWEFLNVLVPAMRKPRERVKVSRDRLILPDRN